MGKLKREKLLDQPIYISQLQKIQQSPLFFLNEIFNIEIISKYF